MKITVQDYRRTQTKHNKANKGHGWTKLERIEMDCIWVNLKNNGPPFKFMSGGGVALGRILFVLPKMWSKLELSLMRLLRAKFGKICQWTKKIKDAVVYGWGTQIFPKSPKENKNSLNMSTACLLRKIDAQ